MPALSPVVTRRYCVQLIRVLLYLLQIWFVGSLKPRHGTHVHDPVATPEAAVFCACAVCCGELSKSITPQARDYSVAAAENHGRKAPLVYYFLSCPFELDPQLPRCQSRSHNRSQRLQARCGRTWWAYLILSNPTNASRPSNDLVRRKRHLMHLLPRRPLRSRQCRRPIRPWVQSWT